MFDAFGKPRATDGNTLTPPRLQNLTLSRNGFTDHRHLDEVELIHMNGRAYDYNLGRFLSVDPIIQSPGNSQSLNPYSYIMNNPLAGTDPTGYCAAATGTRIKSCGDMKVDVKVTMKDGSSATKSTVVKNVNFKNGADVSRAIGKGAVQAGGQFTASDIGSQQNLTANGKASGDKNYLVSRPLNSGNETIDSNSAHMFIAAGAHEVGDENAEVFSYGKLANGKTGNVGPGSSPDPMSADTYSSDYEFWIGLAGEHNAERAKQHTTLIRASTETVMKFARSLRADTPYAVVSFLGIFQKELISTNSNAAALAVANRSASYGAGRIINTPLPDPSRIETNTVFWHHIAFDGIDAPRNRILKGDKCEICRHE